MYPRWSREPGHGEDAITRSSTRRRLAPLLATAVLLASWGACDADSGVAERPSWLFVLDAPRASATAAEITFAGVNDSSVVYAFTDRPSRRSRHLTAGQLVADWADLFGDDPPNAALTEPLGDSLVSVIELTGVRLAPEGLTFDYRLIGTTAVPAELARPALFIDDAIDPSCSPASDRDPTVPGSSISGALMPYC